jgi:hypothetical protein
MYREARIDGRSLMKKLLLLVVLAGVGYVIYRQITASKAEQDLWAEATSNPTCANCGFRPPRGLSSVGRALPLQGRSQGFESPSLHVQMLVPDRCGVAGHRIEWI